MSKKRELLDFTDKELYFVTLAFSSFINDRDTWLSKGGTRVVNNAINKISKNGMGRKDHKKILAPLFKFD